MSSYWQDLLTRKPNVTVANNIATDVKINEEKNVDVTRSTSERQDVGVEERQLPVSVKRRAENHRAKVMRLEEIEEKPLPDFFQEWRPLASGVRKIRNVKDRQTLYGNISKKNLKGYARLLKETKKNGTLYDVMSTAERKLIYDNRDQIDDFLSDDVTTDKRRQIFTELPSIPDALNHIAMTVQVEENQESPSDEKSVHTDWKNYHTSQN